MIVELAAALSLSVSAPRKDLGLDVPEICRFVAENLTDANALNTTRFVWKTRLFRAAGIDPVNDDAPTVKAKMQRWWTDHRGELICNVPHSILRDGSILKLAVDSSSTEFINDVVRRWKLDLNQVDADGKTVLDFIDEQRKKSSGSPRFAILNRYYNIFVSGGAKHARDLAE